MKITVKTRKHTKIVLFNKEDVATIKNHELYDKIHHNLLNKAQIKLERATYFKNAFWMEFLVLCLAALITTIALDYFISATGKAGLFPGGLSAITRFFALLTFPNDLQNQSSFYFVYYIILNIPLIIFGYFKLGIKFTLTTFLYIGLSIGFDQMITRIPVINPGEWHIFLDFKLISAIPGTWNTTIWLFIFAIFGGGLIGLSYALTYKVGASSGGTDFVTVWFSKMKNKDIGTVNRNLSFIIMFIVIVSNTALLLPQDINETIKLSVLNGLTNEQLALNAEIYNNLEIWFNNNNHILPYWIKENNISFEQIMNTSSSSDAFNIKTLFFMYVASDRTFVGYPTSLIVLMKFKFVFGPSLFASSILLIVQGMTINAIYPRNVKRTILMTTTKAVEIQTFLFDSGYRNDILIQDTETTHHGRDVMNKQVLTITISVMNWKLLEKGVMNLDSEMNVNILRTKSVHGPFVNELKDERRVKFIRNKVLDDKKLMAKIEKEAIFKTWKRIQKKEAIDPKLIKKE